MKFKFIILFCLSIWSVRAQEMTQQSASADFKIKNMGFNVDGKFKNVAISASFDSNSLESSYINGTVQVTSIDTDNNKRDQHLRTADYFEVETYSTIKLTSTKIEKTTTNKYQLTAKLKIKKITKTIVIPLEVIEKGNSISIKASFSINRLNYGVGKSSWVLSDTVNIQVNYTGER